MNDAGEANRACSQGLPQTQPPLWVSDGSYLLPQPMATLAGAFDSVAAVGPAVALANESAEQCKPDVQRGRETRSALMVGADTRRLCNRAAIILLLLCVVMPDECLGQRAQPPEGVLDQFSNALQLLAERVSAAVVEIHVSAYGKADDDDPDASLIMRQHITGSGVIVDPNGYVITSAHIVTGAKIVRVFLRGATGGWPQTVFTKSGLALDAAVIGTDEQIDLAVLKINATGLPTLAFADYGNLKPGQMVIAIGSPLGAHSAVTFGIISSVARQLEGNQSATYIQTDAALNPGSSGGALVDASGKLVGINTLIMDGERQGFAIPCDAVKFSYQQIRERGQVSRGDVGFDVQDITPTIAAGLRLQQESGVIVADVPPTSPAERADIRPGDLILAVDGHVVSSVLDFFNRVEQKSPGRPVELQIRRNLKAMSRTVTAQEKKAQPGLSRQTFEPERSLIAPLGVFVLEVDKSTAESVPGIRQRSGVVVAGKSAAQGGTEGQSELEIGDIIHEFNGVNINSVAELRAATRKLQAGDAVVLRVERKRRLLYVAFENE